MKYYLLILFVAIAFSSQAQSAFRIKVIDADNSNPIEKALVYIEEIPLPDQETDINGFVTFKNVPEDRKVKLNIRKKGYIPFQDEVVANRTLTIDNYKIVKLSKESDVPQVIIFGEVSDKNGEELEDATVEVSILGKPFTSVTDKSGNYQIKIDGNILKSVPTFQIEAKKAGCERYKTSESVPKSEIINKDIVLQCSANIGGGNGDNKKQNLKPITTLNNGNLTFDLINCIQSGRVVKIEFTIKSTEDAVVYVWNNHYSRFFDAESGKEFNPSQITIGGETNNDYYSTRKSIIAGYPVKMIMEFTQVSVPVKKISRLDIMLWNGPGGTIEFRDILVKNDN